MFNAAHRCFLDNCKGIKGKQKDKTYKLQMGISTSLITIRINPYDILVGLHGLSFDKNISQPVCSGVGFEKACYSEVLIWFSANGMFQGKFLCLLLKAFKPHECQRMLAFVFSWGYLTNQDRVFLWLNTGSSYLFLIVNWSRKVSVDLVFIAKLWWVITFQRFIIFTGMLKMRPWVH